MTSKQKALLSKAKKLKGKLSLEVDTNILRGRLPEEMFPQAENLTLQEKKAVAAFKAMVEKEYGDHVKEFRLFGSRARGEGHEESDVDILVLVDGVTRPMRSFVYGIPADIFLEYEINISPLLMSRQQLQELKERERLIAKEIERDGIRL